MKLRGSSAGMALLLVAGAGAERPAMAAGMQPEDDIVVTSGKMGATPVQDMPMAIAAVSGAALASAGATDIRDLVALTPGLQITQNASFAQIYIRGIGSNSVFGGSDPSVTVHMDGVYLARPVSYLTDFLDVERIEVLRGPQPTLYGRNAIGGTINIVSRLPGDRTEAEARLTAGNYGLVRADARISGPIVPGQLSASVTLLGTRRGAYLHNIVPGVGDADSERTFGARGQLRLTVSPAADIVLRADYAHSNDAIGGYADILQRTADPLANSIIGDYRRVALNIAPHSDRRFWGLALEGDIDLDGATLRTISAYRESRLRQVGDSDATALNLRRTDQYEAQRQYSQEIDLNGVARRLTWLAGASYFGEHIDVASTLSSFPTTRASYMPTISTSSVAAFGSANYRLTRWFALTAALRYTHEEKRFDQSAVVTSLATGLALPGSPQGYSLKGIYNATSPKLGVELRAAGHLLFYASVTNGFKSGGFNFSSLNRMQGFAPEKLWSYEGGAKLDLLGGAAHINGTGFHYEYSNLQVQTSIAPGVVDIGNAAKARVNGVELEVAATVRPGLHVGSSLTWLDARYRDYRSAVAPGNIPFDASGNYLNLAPRWSGLIYGEVKRPLRRGILSARAEFSRRSRQYFDTRNSEINQQPAYSLINASVGFMPAGDHIRMEAFGRNLTDAKYLTSTATFLAAAAGRVGAPRTYGARITWVL